MADNQGDDKHSAKTVVKRYSRFLSEITFLEESLINEETETETIRSVLSNYVPNDNGMFCSEDVQQMLVDFHRAQKSNNRMKIYILISICLIILLTVCNLGVTFLILGLSRDLNISNDGVMKKFGNDSILKTKTVGHVWDVNALLVQAQNEDGSYKQNNNEWKACVSMHKIDKLYQDSLNGFVTVVNVKTDEDGTEKSITIKGNTKKNTQDGTGSFSDTIFYRPGCNDSSDDRNATIGSSPDLLF